jgi:hypothetical protein
MITKLKSKWIELVSEYNDDQTIIASLWDEILKH